MALADAAVVCRKPAVVVAYIHCCFDHIHTLLVVVYTQPAAADVVAYRQPAVMGHILFAQAGDTDERCLGHHWIAAAAHKFSERWLEGHLPPTVCETISMPRKWPRTGD